MRLQRAIPAGLLDSGFASLATFAVGLYAARFLDPALLGLYALYFAAYAMASMVGHQGLYVPFEAWAAKTGSGLRHLRTSLTAAWLPALLTPLILSLPALLGPAAPTPEASLHLALTGGAAALVSPVQDHIRRMLHLSGRSFHAVAVSVLHFATVLVALLILHDGYARTLVPFGALAMANVVSLLAGLIFAALLAREPATTTSDEPAPGLWTLMRSGRWLLTAQSSSEVSAFGAATLLAQLGSLEALGVAEAARIVGRPVLVLTTGLTGVLGPRLMRAGGRADLGEARRLRRIYAVSISAAALAYVAAFGWAHGWNPLASLIPLAFVAPGLVLATILANALRGMVLPWRFEAIGAGRAVSLARIDVAAGVAQLATGLFAGVLQSFTLAAGVVAFAACRAVGLRSVADSLYHRPSREDPRSVAHAI